jgi:hypothetical protein
MGVNCEKMNAEWVISPKGGFNPLSLRERARVRGLKKGIFLIDPLIPTFSRRKKEQNAKS